MSYRVGKVRLGVLNYLDQTSDNPHYNLSINGHDSDLIPEIRFNALLLDSLTRQKSRYLPSNSISDWVASIYLKPCYKFLRL